MAQRAASYGEAVLHKSLTMKLCFATAPQYEASPVFISLRRGKPFHSDMKHFAYAPYDLSSIALRATDDEKMKNESLSVCNTTLSALYYDLQSSPLWLDFFMPRFYPQNRKHLQQYHRPDREQTENGKIYFFRCVLHRSSQNSLFGQVAGPFQEIISQSHNIYQSNFIFFHCLKCLCLCALTLNRKSL